MSAQRNSFPKYMLKIDENRVFLSFQEAYTAYNSGSSDVRFGRYVLHEDFTVRMMDDADRSKISQAADRLEASK